VFPSRAADEHQWFMTAWNQVGDALDQLVAVRAYILGSRVDIVDFSDPS
jgi:hypothetical protein